MAKKIKIYSTPNCFYCKIAKDFFKKHKIEFSEVDVSEDEDALNEMVEKSGQMGVPVITIDSKVLVGYNEAQLKKAIGIK